ncbi:hypothetical protein M2163_000750 [Streptomyces sp. SAI-135]|nr:MULTISPECIES: hypothetical protein [unclassified Streptomyces]MDH6522743.1 hypothetical protein [Streptomyces sp. SAI-090]MDH6554364.1 hypothetical protein [Streptomyces sp. SAI-041]MDH6573627.1 hypothetical protein [Streptomyces sp. SAI-117]MDH6581637.1 hypothetical protein [Streptomyces sp. SAI-133]MDH6613642.1 hypothetical protein [Streptomyces sp. SAI-135]
MPDQSPTAALTGVGCGIGVHDPGATPGRPVAGIVVALGRTLRVTGGRPC